jgi:peroxiredoxin
MNAKRLIPILLILAMAAVSCGPKGTTKPGGLDVGDDAYPFHLTDTTGQKRSLGDVKSGWSLLMIFYRGHWCEACRNQLLDLKIDYARFSQLRVAIACISSEDRETSAEFSNTWKFPFPILSDTSLEVIDAYGFRHVKGNEDKDISKPGVIIVSPQKKVVYKRMGHSPIDLPNNQELLDWIQQHLFVDQK